MVGKAPIATAPKLMPDRFGHEWSGSPLKRQEKQRHQVGDNPRYQEHGIDADLGDQGQKMARG